MVAYAGFEVDEIHIGLMCDISAYVKQGIMEAWRKGYNNYRPHSSLGYLTPAEFARRYYEKKQIREVPTSYILGN